MEIPVPEEQARLKIEISFDSSTGVFETKGCDANPVVALGMLDYALARVRRALGTNDILQEARNSLRLHLPRGPLV